MRLERAKAYAAEHGYAVEEARGLVWVDVPRETLGDFFQAMQELGFNYLANVIGIDYSTYPEPRPERYAVLHELVSIKGWKDGDGSRFFARIWVPERDPVLPSAVPFYASANFFEREIFDLLGIRFEGHPDLRKILTPEDLEGHPLRKDYPLGETPTQFKDGRYIDPASFRAGLKGGDPGLTGRRGGARRGYAEIYEDVRRAQAAEGEEA
ncbi:NADH-quinone oxidoreductase subunit C [Deinococcota bacterium DY0809b]